MILEPATPAVVSTAMTANLSMAVHTSLLMLPETFTKQQLYTVIAGLSYQGKYVPLNTKFCWGKEFDG